MTATTHHRGRGRILGAMRRLGRVRDTPSEIRAHGEIVRNCLPPDMKKHEAESLIKTQVRMTWLKPVPDGPELVYPTRPPPTADILIMPPISMIFRINGPVHQTRRARLKDAIQRQVLEGNGYSVVDIDYDDREDLWEEGMEKESVR